MGDAAELAAVGLGNMMQQLGRASEGKLAFAAAASELSTWSPKVCTNMGCWAALKGSGPASCMLLGSR